MASSCRMKVWLDSSTHLEQFHLHKSTCMCRLHPKYFTHEYTCFCVGRMFLTRVQEESKSLAVLEAWSCLLIVKRSVYYVDARPIQGMSGSAQQKLG